MLLLIFHHQSHIWQNCGSESSQSKRFAISLQYLKKKKLEMEFIFCMQINIKVSTSWHYRF